MAYTDEELQKIRLIREDLQQFGKESLERVMNLGKEFDNKLEAIDESINACAKMQKELEDTYGFKTEDLKKNETAEDVSR